MAKHLSGSSPMATKSALFNLRPVCAAGLGFAGGILLFEGVFDLPLTCFALLAALLIASFLLYRRGRRGLFLFVLFLSLGLIRARLSMPPAFPETAGTLRGTVTAPAEETARGFRVLLKDASFNSVSLPGRVELTLTTLPAALKTGGSLIAEGTLSPLSIKDTYRRYRRISGTFVPAGEPLLLAGGPGLAGRMEHLRTGLSRRITLLFPRSPGLAAAMLIGERSFLDPEASHLLYDAGIGHLAAVSGLHVGILAAALSKILPKSRQRLHFALIFLFLLFYCLLCRFTPSVVRAAVMFLLYRLSILIKRPYDLASALCTAGLFILLYNPASLFFAGFQLSFLAIVGLVLLEPLFRPPLEGALSETGKFLSASPAVTLSTLPGSIALFSRFSLLSLPANLLAIPLASLFLIPGALSLLLSFLSLPLGRIVAFFPNLVLGALLVLSRVFSIGAVTVPALPASAIILYFSSLLLLSPLCLLPRGEKVRLGLMALLSALLCTLC
ncbi:MAG: ComEC/Rec2 family competence protein [Clostridia bacterium]|nr:ComEC/Rec2 family competence protein [Clostridia bacterium]